MSPTAHPPSSTEDTLHVRPPLRRNLSFNPGVPQVASVNRTADSDRIARRLSQPRKGRIEDWWLPDKVIEYVHLCVSVAAFVNALAFPAVLAFQGRVRSSSAWFYTLVVLDVVLWTDVVSRFLSPQWEDGRRVFDHRRVALAYARGDLFHDLISRFPWDLLLLAIGQEHIYVDRALAYNSSSVAGQHASAHGYVYTTTAGSSNSEFAFGFGHLARLLLAPQAVALLSNPNGPRSGHHTLLISPRRRLASLMLWSFLLLHWYACLLWLVGARLEHSGKTSWLTLASDELAPEPWQRWPLWAAYFLAFDHAALTVIGEGVRGMTYEEVPLGVVGLLGGTLWLAYFTSTLVQLLATLNRATETALTKISSIRTFCNHARLTPELKARVINRRRPPQPPSRT